MLDTCNVNMMGTWNARRQVQRYSRPFSARGSIGFTTCAGLPAVNCMSHAGMVYAQKRS